MQRRLRSDRGFSLVELLVIFGLLLPSAGALAVAIAAIPRPSQNMPAASGSTTSFVRGAPSAASSNGTALVIHSSGKAQTAAAGAAMDRSTSTERSNARVAGARIGAPNAQYLAVATAAAGSQSLPPPSSTSESGLVLGAATSSTAPVTHAEFDAALTQLRADLYAQVAAARSATPISFSGPAPTTPISTQAFAASQKIDNLTGVTISNSTIDTASIPDLSGKYLSLNGGTVSGTTTFSGGFTGPNDFTVQQSSGYVGIGTQNPQTVLDVRQNGGGGIQAGTGNIASLSLIRTNSTLRWAGYNLGSIDFCGTINNYTNIYCGAEIRSFTDYNPQGTEWSASSSAGDLQFATNGAGESGMLPRLVISGPGLVGIGNFNAGTNSFPSNQLDISLPSDATAKTTDFSAFNLANTATSTTANKIKSGVRISSTGTWNGSGASNIGLYVSSVSGGTSNYDAVFNGGGNVGIGTISPNSFKLQVAGSVGPDASNSYNLGAAGSNWGCLYYNGGTTGTCASDQRLKTNIQTLTFDTASSTALDQIAGLTLRSFAYKTATSSIYHGLIAQEVQQVAPELVAEDASTTLLSVKYGDIQWLAVQALQELIAKVNDLAETVTGFVEKFTTNELTFNRATGTELSLQQLNTGRLCATKSDGTSVCVTGDQLAALLAQAGGAGAAVTIDIARSPSSTDTASTTPATAPSTSVLPTIRINGQNPAIIFVGDAYNDLGATILSPDADKNLGIKTFLNGKLVSNIVIDTTQVATDTIDYVVTDAVGLTSTSTRAVVIQPRLDPPTLSSTATSTPSTDATPLVPSVRAATGSSGSSSAVSTTTAAITPAAS